MKNKAVILTMTAVSILAASNANAATESKSYQLSVTIPPHALIPQESSTSASTFPQLNLDQNKEQVQLVQVRRDNQDMLLKTYVTK